MAFSPKNGNFVQLLVKKSFSKNHFFAPISDFLDKKLRSLKKEKKWSSQFCTYLLGKKCILKKGLRHFLH